MGRIDHQFEKFAPKAVKMFHSPQNIMEIQKRDRADRNFEFIHWNNNPFRLSG